MRASHWLEVNGAGLQRAGLIGMRSPHWLEGKGRSLKGVAGNGGWSRDEATNGRGEEEEGVGPEAGGWGEEGAWLECGRERRAVT